MEFCLPLCDRYAEENGVYCSPVSPDNFCLPVSARYAEENDS